MVHTDGAPSLTEFRVMERRRHPVHGPLALIRCIPRTGRTHQIRVHLAHSGHPVLGDKVYGPSEECFLEFIETGLTPSLLEKLRHPRHALHSSSLSVTLDGEHHHWEDPLREALRMVFYGTEGVVALRVLHHQISR